ncbi:MAG: ABC transporter ATP-binding protein [Anaerolineales bacterium]|jgi:ABC-2 type transport system ATP-binding protein
MSAALEIDNIHKHFKEVHAVNGVSFSVEQGEIFSLLGPNGAGKSTTISIISGLLEPTEGQAFVMGKSVLKDPIGAKQSLGVVPQEVSLYPDLTAQENLDFWGKMYGLRGKTLKKRVDEILDLIGLTDRRNDRVDTYSGGMKRRLNIGAALMHRPQVIIMDEPTVGIDPQSRRNILDSVKEFNQSGMTVLYTTHYMEEAQELSDRIAIMDYGQIIALGTHEELVKIVGELDRIELTTTSMDADIVKRWNQIEGVEKVVSDTDRVTLLVQDSNKILPQIFTSINSSAMRITAIEIEEPNLEAVFLHLTGRALRE